jgi:hypothetical protein
MNQDEWRDFLHLFSRVLLAKDTPDNDDVNRPNFSPEIHERGYIGFDGATEEQIAAAEARLGVRLPPSYRTFLSVSNGWPVMWHSVEPGELWPAERIGLWRVQDPEAVEVWGTQQGEETSPEEHRRSRGEDEIGYREQYVQNLIAISDRGDACDLLLSPEVVDSDGEWECWKIASWIPGAHRFRSFEDWFRDAYAFHAADD